MARKPPPIIVINDDEWVTISWSGQHEQCCRCGAVHKVDYRVKHGELQFKARRMIHRSLLREKKK
jgi:hypothetical protein